MLYCTVLYCAVLYTVLYCTVPYTVLCCTVLYRILYCTVLYTVLYCILYCAVLYCILYCAVLYYTVLYTVLCCTVLYCTVYCTVLYCILYCTVPMLNSETYQPMYCGSYRANVGECERSTRQVCWSKFAGAAELHESIQFNSDLKHTQSLHVLHIWHNKARRRVHGKPNVMCCLQISCRMLMSELVC